MNLKVKCDREGIEEATKIIQKGGIVVFPTDTVYGIGCNPYNKSAVERVYKIKKREFSKPYPVLGYSKEDLSKIAEINEQHEKIIKKFWPGSVTIITKIKDEKIKSSMRLDDKIAVRMPNNKCVLEILKNCKFLVGTSANISGGKSFTNPEQGIQQIDEYDLFVDGGKINSVGESTIIELENNNVKIHREGKITKEEIVEIL